MDENIDEIVIPIHDFYEQMCCFGQKFMFLI